MSEPTQQSTAQRKPSAVSFNRRVSTGMRRNKFGSISAPSQQPVNPTLESTTSINRQIPEIGDVYMDEPVEPEEESTGHLPNDEGDAPFAPWGEDGDVGAEEEKSILPSAKLDPEPERQTVEGSLWKEWLVDMNEVKSVPPSPPRTLFSDVVANYPTIVMLLTIALPCVLMYLAVTTDGAFETGIDDFRPLHHPTVRANLAFQAALAEWSSLQERRQLTYRERSVPKYRLFVQFSAKDGLWEPGRGNANSTDLFTEDNLRFIQQVEQSIFLAKNFPLICWTNNQKLGETRSTFPTCVPPSTVSTYFYPGGLRRTPTGFVEFALSGLGTVFQGPVDRVMTTILQNERFKWFVDPGFSMSNPRSSLLRTQITLGFPVLSNGTEISMPRYNALVDAFIVDLVKRLDAIDDPKIKVTLGGDRIMNALLGEILYDEILYAAIGLIIAFLIMCAYMRSLFLGSAAVVQMTLVYVSSFYLFTQWTSTWSMSLISAVTVIVTFAFGSHGLLVTYETFVHSGIWANTGRKTLCTIEHRIAFVYRRAVSGLAVSHACAGAAFLCDALSPVPAMKDFSLMMLLNIGFNFYFSFLFFPAAIAFYHWHFSRRTHSLIHQRKAARHVSEFARHPTMSKFLESEEATKVLYDEPTVMMMKEAAGAPLLPSATAMLRDPLKRKMSMSMSAANFDSPSKATYLSPRMIPLSCIFQINSSMIVPATGRSTVVSALQSYGRRIVAEGGSILDDIAPAVVVEGGVSREIPLVEVERHHVKWEFVGRFIGTQRSDEFSPFITEQLSNSLTGNTVWNDKRAYLADEFVDIGAPIEGEECERVYPRECGGLLTERPRGLTREEKDSEKLNITVQHQGYTVFERLMTYILAMVVFKGRYVICIGGIGVATLMLIFAAQFSPLSGDPLIIDRFQVVNGYDDIRRRFAGQGNCDYCSAYQRKLTELPQFTINALQECIVAGYGLQMNAELDRCGICYGNNTCIDCADRPNGGQAFDFCGFCANSNDENRCLKCEVNANAYLNTSCWYCATARSLVGFAGPNCQVACNNNTCPSTRGACNPWTGECECHADFDNGFYATDPSSGSLCSACLTGFSQDSLGRCTVECDDSTNTGDCRCSGGRCQNCTAFSLGSQCAVKNPGTCKYGTLGADKSCNCPADYDQNRCRGHSTCSFQGELIGAAASSDGQSHCLCFGQYVGSKCEYCRCKNGGRCDNVTGECICPGAWTGFDCTTCAHTCLQRGFCPTQFTDLHYDESSCAAAVCSVDDLNAGRVCRECDRRNATLCNPLNETMCRREKTKCLWDNTTASNVTGNASGSCEAIWEIAIDSYDSICTGCVGAWVGDTCDDCPVRAEGLDCTNRGVIIGCDGLPTPYGRPVRRTDSCGVCNGPNQCLGCEGVLGSQLVLDQCGVCGGSDECITGGSLTVSADFVWGILPEFDIANGTYSSVVLDRDVDFTDVAFQQYLYDVCIRLLYNNTDFIISSKSSCAWLEFVDWLRNSTLSGPFASEVNANITFPFTSPEPRDIHRLLFHFAANNNRFADLGFNSVNGAQPDLVAQFFRVRLVLVTPVESTSTEILETYAELEDIREVIAAMPGSRGVVINSSPYWSLAIARQSATQVVIYSIFLSSLVFIVGTLAVSMQPFLTFIGLICNFIVMGASFFIFFTLEWELGPVEQLAFSMSVGFSSEYVVHIITGYNEHIEIGYSPLLLAWETRLHAVKTAMLRVTTSVLASALCAICVSFTIAFSPVRLFARVGIVLASTQAMSVAYALFFFCAVMLLTGPTTIRRFRHDRGAVLVAAFVVGITTILSIALTGQLELNVSDGSIEL